MAERERANSRTSGRLIDPFSIGHRGGQPPLRGRRAAYFPARDDGGMTKPSSGDRRWLVSILLLTTGVVIVLLTRALRGDSWSEFIGTPRTASVGLC